MIELSRYIRLKPDGLVTVALAEHSDCREGLYVYFKRFDVENGKEVEPETCFVSWKELEAKLSEAEKNIVALRELLVFKPKV